MSIDEAQGYLAGDSNNGHSLEVAFALPTPINFIKPIQYCKIVLQKIIFLGIHS